MEIRNTVKKPMEPLLNEPTSSGIEDLKLELTAVDDSEGLHGFDIVLQRGVVEGQLDEVVVQVVPGTQFEFEDFERGGGLDVDLVGFARRGVLHVHFHY